MKYLLIIAFFQALASNQGFGQTSKKTSIVRSKDGTNIAFDVTGSGPHLLLLHGGGQTRDVWHTTGYVKRLQNDFTVVTIDLRGNGESDKPTEPAHYSIDRLIEDILTVADSVGAEKFSLWGFSYGANIGRYIASRTNRVQSMIYIGIPFGPAANGDFRTAIEALREKWLPIVQASKDGRLDVSKLPQDDRKMWESGSIPLSLAWLSAMLDYPTVEPQDMRCPTLWLVGTLNTTAYANTSLYVSKLQDTQVSIKFIEGLSHSQELSEIDKVLPIEYEFTREKSKHK